MTVFDAFDEVEFSYLTVSRGNVYGNRVTSTTPMTGVFKYRGGMTAQDDRELHESSATVHAHPEDFADVDDIVGNGILYDGESYQILGVTVGRNFDNGKVEHLTLTLGAADYAHDSHSA